VTWDRVEWDTRDALSDFIFNDRITREIRSRLANANGTRLQSVLVVIESLHCSFSDGPIRVVTGIGNLEASGHADTISIVNLLELIPTALQSAVATPQGCGREAGPRQSDQLPRCAPTRAGKGFSKYEQPSNLSHVGGHGRDASYTIG
jgi:hypothetical protein